MYLISILDQGMLFLPGRGRSLLTALRLPIFCCRLLSNIQCGRRHLQDTGSC